MYIVVVSPMKTFHRAIKNKHRQNCVSINLLLKVAGLVDICQGNRVHNRTQKRARRCVLANRNSRVAARGSVTHTHVHRNSRVTTRHS